MNLNDMSRIICLDLDCGSYSFTRDFSRIDVFSKIMVVESLNHCLPMTSTPEIKSCFQAQEGNCSCLIHNKAYVFLH